MIAFNPPSPWPSLIFTPSSNLFLSLYLLSVSQHNFLFFLCFFAPLLTLFLHLLEQRIQKKEERNKPD